MKLEQMINKVHCADCLEFMKDIPDNSIDCIYTDVPYLYQTGGGGSSKLALRIRNNINNLDEHKITNGFDIKTNLKEWTRVMKKVNLFIWCSKLQILDILKEIEKIDREIYTEILVWAKTNPTPSTNNIWLPDIEYCLYFREKGVKLNDGYFYKQKWFKSGINKEDKDKFQHPTIKPIMCVEKHLQHTTQENDLILDPFLGSGTTAVAAQNLKRRFIGIEKEEKYCQIARERLRQQILL